MKKFCFILVSLILLLSCEKSDNTCNCNNPIEDLTWLKEFKNSLTNCFCEMSIIQAAYNKQTVFYTAMTDPLCDGLYPVVLLDCNGKSVKSYEPGDQALLNEVSNMKVLYRCKK